MQQSWILGTIIPRSNYDQAGHKYRINIWTKGDPTLKDNQHHLRIKYPSILSMIYLPCLFLSFHCPITAKSRSSGWISTHQLLDRLLGIQAAHVVPSCSLHHWSRVHRHVHGTTTTRLSHPHHDALGQRDEGSWLTSALHQAQSHTPCIAKYVRPALWSWHGFQNFVLNITLVAVLGTVTTRSFPSTLEIKKVADVLTKKALPQNLFYAIDWEGVLHVGSFVQWFLVCWIICRELSGFATRACPRWQ